MRFWYRAEVEAVASRHGLDPDVVEAICLTESSGETIAYRYEPLFWSRYMQGKPAWDGANPKRVSASYGLMQVMFPVAVEMGMPRTDAPESLCVPVVGLEYGCRVLVDRLQWSHGDLLAALASYNGGKTADNAPGVEKKRNQQYVGKVLVWLAKVQAGDIAA